MKTSTFYLRLLPFHWQAHGVSLICIILYYVSLALSGLIMRAFFDQLTGGPENLTLSLIVILQLLNTGLTLLGLDGANYAAYFFQYHTRALLAKNMFARILHLPGGLALPQQKNISVGAAVNIFRDDVDQVMDWRSDLGDWIGLIVTAIFAFGVMLKTSVWVTLGTFLPLIVIVLIVDRLSERIEGYRQTSRETSGQVAGAIGDMFEAVQAIQVNQAEEKMLAPL